MNIKNVLGSSRALKEPSENISIYHERLRRIRDDKRSKRKAIDSHERLETSKNLLDSDMNGLRSSVRH